MTDLLCFDRRRLAALADPLLSDSWAVDRRQETTNPDGDQSCGVGLDVVVVSHTNAALLAKKFRIPVCLPAFRTPSVVRYPHVRCGDIPFPTGIVRHGGRGTNGGVQNPAPG